jgi:hypothetical protein
MKFITKITSHAMLHIGYKDRYTEETVNTTFLGLQIDKHLNWKNHIEQMVPKLRGACYAMTSVVYNSNINTFKSVYCAHFHSVIKYGIVLAGNSSNSGEFSLYKRKQSELWLVHNPEPHVEVYLKNSRFCLFHASIYFH